MQSDYLQSLLNEFINFVSNKSKEGIIKKPIYEKTVPAKSFNIKYQSPIKGVYWNLGMFAPGVNLNKRHSKGHNGVDLRAPGGTSVYPISEGVVSRVGSDNKGGNIIWISYPNGIQTYYAHMGTISVQNGDRVDKNTIVGTVGDSGNAIGTAPHIHVEVHDNGQIKNPAMYFNVGQYKLPDKNENLWLSNKDKQIARNFNISKHLYNKV